MTIAIYNEDVEIGWRLGNYWVNTILKIFSSEVLQSG